MRHCSALKMKIRQFQEACCLRPGSSSICPCGQALSYGGQIQHFPLLSRIFRGFHCSCSCVLPPRPSCKNIQLLIHSNASTGPAQSVLFLVLDSVSAIYIIPFHIQTMDFLPIIEQDLALRTQLLFVRLQVEFAGFAFSTCKTPQNLPSLTSLTHWLLWLHPPRSL